MRLIGRRLANTLLKSESFQTGVRKTACHMEVQTPTVPLQSSRHAAMLLEHVMQAVSHSLHVVWGLKTQILSKLSCVQASSVPVQTICAKTCWFKMSAKSRWWLKVQLFVQIYFRIDFYVWVRRILGCFQIKLRVGLCSNYLKTVLKGCRTVSIRFWERETVRTFT